MAFDYDLFVIGAGPGGLAAAKLAASLGARVAIAERSAIGGACVNYGCIPERLMTYAARFSNAYQDASAYGWDIGTAEVFPSIRFNWSRFIAAKNREVQHLNQVHLDKLKATGVEFIQAPASFLDPHTLRVGKQQITADKILIAVGAKPSKPDIPGVEHAITWHELFKLEQQPDRIAILGSHYIAVKFAGILSHLGSQVIQIFPEDRILSRFDHDLSQAVQNNISHQGTQLFANTKVEKIEQGFNELKLTSSSVASRTIRDTSVLDSPILSVDAVLVDTERTPALDDLGLEQAGVTVTSTGAIAVDDQNRTGQAHIFAVGDCTNSLQVTPVAIAQAEAFVNREFGNQHPSHDYAWVPIYLATQPEAAAVGMTEAQAQEKLGDAAHCYQRQFKPLFYSLTPRSESTLMKLVVDGNSDRILGIHMVGESAIEIVQTLAIALKLRATLQDFRTAIGIHPSIAEEFWSI